MSSISPDVYCRMEREGAPAPTPHKSQKKVPPLGHIHMPFSHHDSMA